jgi:hypothetical protein
MKFVSGHRPKAENVCAECGCSGGNHRQGCPTNARENAKHLLETNTILHVRVREQEDVITKLRARMRSLEASNKVLRGTVENIRVLGVVPGLSREN